MTSDLRRVSRLSAKSTFPVSGNLVDSVSYWDPRFDAASSTLCSSGATCVKRAQILLAQVFKAGEVSNSTVYEPIELSEPFSYMTLLTSSP